MFLASKDAICSRRDFVGEENKMSDEILSRVRYGEAFWRTMRHGGAVS